MVDRSQHTWVRGLSTLGVLWGIGAVGDRLWFALDQSIPSWDQAEYLTGALNYWRALQTPHWFSGDWWIEFWMLSSKIPPLVYISTAPFLSLFGGGFDQSTLVNLIYSGILLGAVYALGVCLFSVSVGLWAAGFCLLMPGLYRVRLDYLMDYPLAAMVTLCFACLTLWRHSHSSRERFPVVLPHASKQSWLLAIATGMTLGLALMVKQPALLFLIVPLIGATVVAMRQRAWMRLAQLGVMVGVASLVFGPWYRTNWLIILTAGKRATVDSALSEGDPSLLSLDAWTFYLQVLPRMVSLPLFWVGVAGLLLFWRRSRVSSQWDGSEDYAPKTQLYRQQAYGASRRSLGWLLLFWLGGYLLSSLNINKDVRYVVPYLPVVALILAYGFALLPKRWNPVRWAAVGLAIALMVYNLIPGRAIGLHNMISYHPFFRSAPYPHAEVVKEVINAAPYLQSTIGVLPSTPEINQHNVNYYGNLQNQVYGRQVGVKLRHVAQDARSLPWFLTKTGDQGSIRQPEAHLAITQQVENSANFRLQRQWRLSDGSDLQLFQTQVPLLEVNPLNQTVTNPTPGSPPPAASPVLPNLQLDSILLPDQAAPGQPIPVTYRWSGDWQALQSGLVLLTWHRQGTALTHPGRWLHDHAIAQGFLHRNADTATRYQVVERMTMLPPPQATPGTYTLDAVYLNRNTGKTGVIALPPISLRLTAATSAAAAPELDLVTQLRSLAATLPQGTKALDRVFDQVGRINQYDPTQDYLEQTRQSMEWRLKQEPNNRDFAYALSLTHVLQRRANSAIAALQTVTRLDPDNPYAYAYLAFVNLYDFRPQAAQVALNAAFKLKPTPPELHALNGLAALMQGNVMHAWQEVQAYQKLAKQRKNATAPTL